MYVEDENGAISDALKEVIGYLDDGTVSGDYSRELEHAVNHVKTSEERRHEYMIMWIHEQEMKDRARAKGLAEGLAKGKAGSAR